MYYFGDHTHTHEEKETHMKRKDVAKRNIRWRGVAASALIRTCHVATD